LKELDITQWQSLDHILEDRRKIVKPDVLIIIKHRCNEGLQYSGVGNWIESVKKFEEALKMMKNISSKDQMLMTNIMYNLGLGYRILRKFDLSATILKNSLDLGRQMYADEDSHVLRTMRCLAGTYKHLGRLQDAVALFEKVWQIQKSKLGSENQGNIEDMRMLSDALVESKQWEKAENLYQSLPCIVKKTKVDEYPDILYAKDRAAKAYFECGRFGNAKNCTRDYGI
jgi:tetratricopeptide (TPR) repeat protein